MVRFRGFNAAASLKLDAPTILAEAASGFRGFNAAASLKRRLSAPLRRTVRRFRGFNAAASLKPSALLAPGPRARVLPRF